EMIAAILAVLKGGAAYLPLDTKSPTDRLRYCMSDSGMTLLLTGPGLGKGLAEIETLLVCIEDEEESLKGYGVENLPSGLNQDNVAYVIYTSGSTGRPKGVACTHRAVMNLLDDFEKRQQLGSGDSCALWTSVSFDVSVYEIFSAL